MKWSFRLARIADIDVRVHVTFLLLLAWIAYGDYSAGGLEAMWSGLAFILLLFACVVLHEFGHALAARGYGIRTPDITLLPIGGVARLERMPDNPWQELVVALAGPAVNVVIAAGLLAVLGRIPGTEDISGAGGGSLDLLAGLLVVNVMLVLFNLLPAFPMDGGRILRAILATRLKYARATRIAAGIGQATAVIFGALGLMTGHPILVLIAVFVFFGAQQEAVYASAREIAEETRVAQLVDASSPTLPAAMAVLDAVQVAMRNPRPAYPVVDANLRVTGLVTPADLAAALESGPAIPVGVLGSGDFRTLSADESLASALRAEEGAVQPLFPVLNPAGQIVGCVSRDRLRRPSMEGA